MGKIDKYLKIIWLRWKAPKNKTLFFWWVVLRFKKMFKVGFDDRCSGGEEAIDIVIPTVSKDYELLDVYLEAIKNICHKINKVYVVSGENQGIIDFCVRHNCVFVDELSVLGYGKSVIHYDANGVDRSGWIFQQLLKLSGEKFVEMQNYIIVDSDTVLLNRHCFLKKGKFVFLQNEEWNEPYFQSFIKIFGYPVRTKLSFTSHMMVFNTEMLRLMKKEMERRHNKSWDQVYLSTIDSKEQSCISDYEIYANWVLCNFKDKVITKPFYNKSVNRKLFSDLDNLQANYGKNLKSVSFHSYVKS